MQSSLTKKDMLEFAEIVATSVVTALKREGIINNTTNVVNQPNRPVKTAYQKTEQLLYNYLGFKKIIAERQQEMEDIRKYGAPQKSSSAMGDKVQTTRIVHGLMLPEESVEAAVHTVERSVQGTVQAVALIDKCMAALKYDQYYKVLEMFYFDGRTQEDIAVEFGCNQATIARNKSRLVRELAMRIFPDQVAQEMMN